MRLVAGGPGIGDGLVLTGVVRVARRLYPDLPIEVVVGHPELWKNNPDVTRVRLWDNAWNDRSFPEFDGVGQGTECQADHLIQVMCRKRGLEPPTRADARPWMYLDSDELHAFQFPPETFRPKGYITVHCQPGAWTVNRDWPIGHWAKLVARLRSRGFVTVQLGGLTDPVLATDIDARGCALRETAIWLAHARVHVGAISGPMHLAAAVDTRAAVIIFSAREDPNVIAYLHQHLVLTASPLGFGCTPCWATQPCPFGRSVEFEWRKPCMDVITVGAAERAVIQAATQDGVRGLRYLPD